MQGGVRLTGGLLIRRIRAHLLRAPIERPVTTSFGAMTARSALLVRVEDGDGAFGWGEVWCNFPACAAEHRFALIDQVLGPLLIEERFEGPESVSDRLSAETAVLALQSAEAGPFAQTIAGIDMACWDLTARRFGVPLYRLLGGGRQTVPAYASGINPRGAPETVEQARADGFRAFKLKVGFENSVDLDNIRHITEGLDRDETLMIDANQAWDLEQASRRCDELAPFGLGWLEEPLRADAPSSDWSALARRSPIPLAAGENLVGLAAFRQAIERGHLGVIQPDAAKWGGVSGCIAVARAALEAGRRFCPHFLGGAVGLAASAHLLAAAGGDGLLEVDVNENPLREALVAPPLELDSGLCRLPDGPGLGIAPDPAALEVFEVASVEIC